MKKEIIFSVIIGLILGMALSPLAFPSMPSYWNDSMMGAGRNANIDAHFIEQMIPHHEDAITMAEIALEKSEHEEIKQLSKDIQKTQTAEINQMQKWHKEWFGKEIVTLIPRALAHMAGMRLRMGMMGDDYDLDSLERAKPFDKAFIEQMIPHHQMAVMMAQMLKTSTNREEMKQLADDIITAQTKEISQMREWYRTWYDN